MESPRVGYPAGGHCPQSRRLRPRRGRVRAERRPKVQGMNGTRRESDLKKALAILLAAVHAQLRVLTGAEARARARELAVLSEVGRIVNSALELPLIVRAVARELYRVIP